MSDHTTTIHIDGASRGNPGPAAYAFVIDPPKGTRIEGAAVMASTTNNIAEYTALVRALERASELGLERLHIYSDSELLVKQMKGEYRVKNEDLKELFDEAQRLLPHFRGVQITHIAREKNQRADELCNIALDGETKRSPKSAGKTGKSTPQRTAITSDDRVRADCIACIHSASEAWAMGDDRAPTAEELWDQLWSILEEGDVLKKSRSGG